MAIHSIDNDREFREEVLQRLTAIEVALKMEKEQASKSGAIWGGIVASLIGLLPWGYQLLKN